MNKGMSDAESSAATVLVVDDARELVDLYEAFLESEYHVRTATSGSEALQACDDTVDMVLLDRRMPDMSGEEVLGELRRQNFGGPVAMLTGLDPDQDILKSPFDDYRVKPVNRSDLLSLVDILLKRATYNKRSHEFFSLASQKASLERSNEDVTEESKQLIERMQELRNELDAMLNELCSTAVVKDPETDDG